MAAPAHTTETTVTPRLSDRTSAKLAKQAAKGGQDLSAIASDLIEHVITRPSIAEIMSPVWEQVRQSGMTEQQIDDFLRAELESHRSETNAKSS